MPEFPTTPTATTVFDTETPPVGPADDGGRTLMQTLRVETQREHEAVEQRVDMPSRLADLAGYRDLICRLYGLYAPLERALRAHYAIDVPQIGMASRWKLQWLEQDLRHFGIDPATVPTFAGRFPLSNRAALLGVLYVIEGSSLGGQLIYRDLQQHLGLTAATGARFFAGYQNEISRQWRGFGEAVNTLVCSFDARQTILSARAMFEIFGDWVGGPRQDTETAK